MFGQNTKVRPRNDGSGKIDVYYGGLMGAGDGMGNGHAVIDGDDNELFIEFMDKSENPYDLISKLNDMPDCAITDHCEDNCYDVTRSDVTQFPNFWKNIAIRFLEDHNEGSHDELYYNLRNLD